MVVEHKKISLEWLQENSESLTKEIGLYAFLRLRIGGFWVGTLDDKTYLPTLKAGLFRMLNSPKLNEKEKEFFLSDQWESILRNDEIEGRFIVSLGDTFDDFLILSMKIDANLVIIWRLLDDTNFSYPELILERTYRVDIAFSEAEKLIQDAISALDKPGRAGH
jgi:hypothetical protein